VLSKLFDANLPGPLSIGGTTATVINATPLEAPPVEALLGIEALASPNDEEGCAAVLDSLIFESLDPGRAELEHPGIVVHDPNYNSRNESRSLILGVYHDTSRAS